MSTENRKKKPITKLRFWKDWEPNPNISRIHAGEVIEFPAVRIRERRKK